MNFIDQITTYIIRPNRQKYHINRLGPKHLLYNTSGFMAVPATREDYAVINKNNQKVVYSFFNNHVTQYPSICVVYLHANNGSRVEGLHYLEALLCNKLNVCILDFSGSGLSQGQYITLGPNQTEDLICVFNDLREKRGITKMVLWGRSMGACTALMYTHRYPQNVVAMILDSPFKDLRKLVKQTASQKTGLPKFFFQPILNFVDDELFKKIGHRFDEYKMKKYLYQDDDTKLEFKNPMNSGKINKKLGGVPTLFLASQMDKLVKSHHVQKLYHRYPGIPNITKFLHYITNQHHQNRDSEVIEKCLTFIMNTLSSRDNMHLKSYEQNNPFNMQNKNIFNDNPISENTKFSFKTQGVVRPQSSFIAENNQNNFCFNINPSMSDNRTNLQYINGSIQEFQTRMQNGLHDSPISKQTQTYSKRFNQKINLSKNQNKTNMNNSFQSSDQSSNINISLNGIGKTSRMMNTLRYQDSGGRAKIKLNQTKRIMNEISDFSVLNRNQSRRKQAKDLRQTIKVGQQKQKYFSSPITITSMKNISGDDYRWDDDAQNESYRITEEARNNSRGVRDYSQIKDKKIDLRIHSRKQQNKQENNDNVKFTNTNKAHHAISPNNENANISNFASTNSNGPKYPDAAMIQSVQNAPSMYMSIPSMHSQNMNMANLPPHANRVEYAYNSQPSAMRSPSPMNYNPMQVPPSQLQFHQQYASNPNRIPNNYYSTAPHPSNTKTQLNKNRSYVNLGNNHSSLNVNSKISLSKLGSASRTNGFHI